MRDRVAGTTERVSVDTSGGDPNSDSWAISISGNGRYVAFVSAASDLVPGDTNGTRDVFVHDRLGTPGAKTARVSVDTAGGNQNGDSEQVAMSADGNSVAFTSTATDLAPCRVP